MGGVGWPVARPRGTKRAQRLQKHFNFDYEREAHPRSGLFRMIFTPDSCQG